MMSIRAWEIGVLAGLGLVCGSGLGPWRVFWCCAASSLIDASRRVATRSKVSDSSFEKSV